MPGSLKVKEMQKFCIDVTLIAHKMVAHFVSWDLNNLVLVGTDRVAANVVQLEGVTFLK